MASAINLTVHLEYDEVVERLKAEGWVIPVRCKDCKWFCTAADNEGSCGWRYIPGGVSGDWFCADGERKGGDE